ncbi:hypothetical protein KUTeg_009690 [Tegillarca granosa]|uniref:AIG1-type G domain-containing protein n=1 Tax=Tegillarca granosa TaxID=220873 RepID=A0ABQ9F7R4_TEGGR|nr:hypothetical protein KUTeg_009690 [Tegillarca granosa]
MVVAIIRNNNTGMNQRAYFVIKFSHTETNFLLIYIVLILLEYVSLFLYFHIAFLLAEVANSVHILIKTTMIRLIQLICILTNKGARKKHQNTGNEQVEELRIVIIGKTGTGKSATGNTILGKNKFDSKASGASVTNRCKLGINRRFDRKIVLVDTPGMFDTEMTNEQVTKEIVKCIGMTAPGPHAFLLTVNIGRFTKEEQDTVKHFVDHFGSSMYSYLFVVFTRADDLENENTAIESYVEEGPPELKAIVKLCNNRYIAFNNRLTGIDQEHQVKRLIDMINDVVYKNEDRFFTNEMYEKAEKTLLRQEQEMRKKLQKEESREIKVIRRQLTSKFNKKFDETQYENNQLKEIYYKKTINPHRK